jgi:hypothetical protein
MRNRRACRLTTIESARQSAGEFRLWAVKPISRSQWNGGFGADSGRSGGDPRRRAIRPFEASKTVVCYVRNTSRAAGRQQRRNLRSGSKAGPWSDTASHGGRLNAKTFSPAPPQAQGHCRRHRKYQILRQAGERLDHGLPAAEEAARGIRRMIAATMAFLRTRPRQRVMAVAISPTSGAPTSIVRAPRG